MWISLFSSYYDPQSGYLVLTGSMRLAEMSIHYPVEGNLTDFTMEKKSPANKCRAEMIR